MNEKEFLRQIIEENVADKEHIQKQVLDAANLQNSKRGFVMKKRLTFAAIGVCLITAMSVGVYAAADAIEYGKAESFLGEIGVEAQELSRSDAKKVFRDMESGKFELPVTQEVLSGRAGELGIEYPRGQNTEIFEALKNYASLYSTGRITSAQIRVLDAGLTYAKIMEILGASKDAGNDVHMVQYLVDGRYLLTFTFAQDSEICAKSGEQLLATLTEVKTDNNSENTFDAVVTDVSERSLMVDCPAYTLFDCASVGIKNNTQIVFADGKPAAIQDIQDGATVTITHDGIVLESYPVQITAVKIVIQ